MTQQCPSRCNRCVLWTAHALQPLMIIPVIIASRSKWLYGRVIYIVYVKRYVPDNYRRDVKTSENCGLASLVLFNYIPSPYRVGDVAHLQLFEKCNKTIREHMFWVLLECLVNWQYDNSNKSNDNDNSLCKLSLLLSWGSYNKWPIAKGQFTQETFQR